MRSTCPFCDYKKKVLTEEVAQLETRIDGPRETARDTQKSAVGAQTKLEQLLDRKYLIDLNICKYDN